MHKTLAALALAASITTHSSAAAQVAVPPVRTIVALGDSLTFGQGLKREEAYPTILNGMLREAGLPFTIVNQGVNGDTTAGGVRRLQAALDANPSILILALGANDGLRGVPVATVRKNLETIIEAAKAKQIAVLLCGMDALPVNGWQYTLDFHNIFPDLAAKYDIPLVPFLLDGVFLNDRMLQQDFVHPNAAGAVQLARNIWAYLQPLTAKVVATN